MIYDRTQEDVDKAKDLIENYVKQFIELTEEQENQLERGTLTINTLYRIEKQIEYLKEQFTGLSYCCEDITIKTDWSQEDVFFKSDYERILHNVDVLKECFFYFSYTPDTPDVSFYFSDINNIEKILSDLEDYINVIKDNYRRCGDYYCGS